MALLIDIDRISEDQDTVCYRYTVGGRSGQFTLRISDGEPIECTPANYDDDRLLMGRAIYKVQKALASGSRPAHLQWAS